MIIHSLSRELRIYGGMAMNLALWIAIGAAFVCAGIAIYYGTKRRK